MSSCPLSTDNDWRSEMHKTARLPGAHGEVYAGWRRWDHWELGFGGWLLDGLDIWLNLGWLYAGVTVWRDDGL